MSKHDHDDDTRTTTTARTETTERATDDSYPKVTVSFALLRDLITPNAGIDAKDLLSLATYALDAYADDEEAIVAWQRDSAGQVDEWGDAFLAAHYRLQTRMKATAQLLRDLHRGTGSK